VSSAAESLVQQIDAWLPQTQCTRCGYPRCRDYAEALAEGESDLNRCPPGGEQTINGLAELLERAPQQLDPEVGEYTPPALAVIREDECIGCTLCIQVCPVDAISGAGKLMHTVISRDCTGCELCIAPCPMDCIDLVPAGRPIDDSQRWPGYPVQHVALSRVRTEQRLIRLARSKTSDVVPEITDADRDRMRDEITAAVTRGRARRDSRSQVVAFGQDSSSRDTSA